MALTKQITLNSGITIENAYIKVFSITYFNNASYDSYVKFNVNIFFNQDARNQGKPEVIAFPYQVSGEDFDVYFDFNVLKQAEKNIVSQAYEYLKSLSFYSDATDIVDIKE